MHLFDYHHVGQWIQHGGPAVLFLLLFSCGLIPLPEDIPLITAGAMVANGKMNLALASICAWCGIMAGDSLLYHLGKVFGFEITRVPLLKHHVTRERLESVEKRFENYGVWVVAIGRLFAGIRGAMVVCAGTIRYPFWKFFIADGLAAIVSGALFLALGYWFGSRMESLLHHVERVKHSALIGVLLLLVIAGAWYAVAQRRRNKVQPAIDSPISDPVK